jgi:hypothetical protein
MKILYVEDELITNTDRIERLFEKYLNEDVKEKLSAFKEKRLKKPDELKNIVEETGLIEVAYRFPDALRKILNDHQKYSLFIIDRNLNKGRYEHAEVREIDSTYNDEKYAKFSQSNREGDYLLNQLILVHKADVEKTFFFLTAYSAKDELRDSEIIGNYIMMKQFAEQNFIEKGNEKDFKRLKKAVDNNDKLNLMHENMPYLHILNKHIDGTTAEIFFNILDARDEQGRIRDNLNCIRIVYENILAVCANAIPEMKKECGDEKGGNTILWLKDENHIDNFILRNFFFSIRKTASEFGSHKPYPYNPIYEPTADTVSALVYALKDVITWFGKICSRYTKDSGK